MLNSSAKRLTITFLQYGELLANKVRPLYMGLQLHGKGADSIHEEIGVVNGILLNIWW